MYQRIKSFKIIIIINLKTDQSCGYAVSRSSIHAEKSEKSKKLTSKSVVHSL